MKKWTTFCKIPWIRTKASVPSTHRCLIRLIVYPLTSSFRRKKIHCSYWQMHATGAPPAHTQLPTGHNFIRFCWKVPASEVAPNQQGRRPLPQTGNPGSTSDSLTTDRHTCTYLKAATPCGGISVMDLHVGQRNHRCAVDVVDFWISLCRHPWQ